MLDTNFTIKLPEQLKTQVSSTNILIAIIIMTGILGTGMIVRDAYKSRVLGEETVRVTGGAEVSFSSDLAVWK